MSDQISSAPGQPDPGQPATPAPFAPPQRAEATVQQPHNAEDPWATTHRVAADPASGAFAGAAPNGVPAPQSPWAAPGSAQYGPAPTQYDPAQTGQPGYGQPTTIEAGQYGLPAYGPMTAMEPQPRRGRKRRPILVSVGVVLLLLIGVGAYAGVRAWTGAGIAEPETAMPAGVGAFARIDFNPGFGAKLSVDGLVKKFPTQGQSTSDLITKLEQKVAQSAGLNYATDVKPWFSGRVGVAEWTDGTGRPVPLIALSSSNDDVAKSTLTRIQAQHGPGDFGFVVQDGYALLAPGSAATAAAAAARQHTLADSDTFKSAVAHLGGDNLLLVYADLDSLGGLLSSAMGSALSGIDGDPGALGPFGGLGPLGGLGGLGSGGLGAGGGPGGLNGMHGQIVVGGAVVDNGVEIRARVLGATPVTPVEAHALAALGGMPASTIVGAAIIPGAAGPGGSTLNGSLPGLLGNVLHGNPQMAQFLGAGLQQLLSAKMLSVGFSGVDPTGMPNLLINVQAKDAASATALMGTVNQLTGGQQTPGVSITQHDATINATVGNPDTNGKLGASKLFEEATTSMANASTVFYVDVQKVATMSGPMPPDVAQYLGPIKAVAVSGGTDKWGSNVLIRVVVK